MIKKFNINVQMEESWIPYFMSVLKRIEYDGSIGHSEDVTLYVDGDGSFRPKFKSNVRYNVVEPIDQDNVITVYYA